MLGAGLLGFLLQQYGHRLIPADNWLEIVGQGLLFILAAWVVIFSIRLAVAPFMIHRDGVWHGNKFVYREPKIAFHAYLSPADNNEFHRFRFLDAPPFAFVNYEFRFEQFTYPELMSIRLECVPPIEPMPFRSHTDLRYKGGGLLVNRRRDMCLTTFMREDADPFSVWVYVKSWESPGPRAATEGPTKMWIPPFFKAED